MRDAGAHCSRRAAIPCGRIAPIYGAKAPDIASGTPNALDLNLVDQIRIMSNSNGAAIMLKIDRIEAIKQ